MLPLIRPEVSRVCVSRAAFALRLTLLAAIMIIAVGHLAIGICPVWSSALIIGLTLLTGAFMIIGRQTRLRGEAHLRSTLRQYRFLAENTGDVVSVHTADGTCVYISPSCQRILRQAPDSLIGRRDLLFVHESDRVRCALACRRALREGRETTIVYRLADNEVRYLETVVQPSEDPEDGRPLYHMTTSDVTEREELIARLRSSQQFSRQLENAIPHILYVYEVGTGNLSYSNSGLEAQYGWTPSPDSRNPFGALIHPEDREAAGLHFARVMESGDGDSFDCEFRLRAADGTYRWLHTHEVVFERGENGIPTHILGVAMDVTHTKEVEEQVRQQMQELQRITRDLEAANVALERLATLDQLTGISNRRAFEQAFPREIERCAIENLPISVIMIDVDHFKHYNDSFGHAAGDEVLRKFARILTHHLPRGWVARYGGEEFVAVVPGANRAVAEAIAEKLRHAVETAAWPNRPITLSAGFATHRHARANPQDLLERADAALYRAKAAGRNRVEGPVTQAAVA